MQKFIEFLKSGRLVSSKCSKCEYVIWPPSDVCPKCLSNDIAWVDVDGNGKLIEFSESFLMEQPCVFGMVELNDNIRLMAKIRCDNTVQLKKGISVRMMQCGIRDNDPYYEFQPI